MSQQIESMERSKICSEDLHLKQHYIVQMDANGEIELGEGATDLLVGVLQNKPKDNEPALYRFHGTAKVKAGGAITVGCWVTSDSAGKGVATVTDKETIIGRALEVADTDDIFEVQLGIFTLSTT